ncbi:MAG: hypothetical protein IV094_21920 [Vitreoscilla sp.]|nr:hypothetical protein [Vitreoscilla sp.]
MALGTSYGGACYSTQLEAATLWCSDVLVAASSGSVFTCSSIVSGASGTTGGAVTFKWVRRQVDAAGVTTTAQINGQQLPDCETYGFDYYSPAIAAWASAMLAVLAARLVWRWAFSRESV